MTEPTRDGFVEEGPERSKGYEPGFWNFIWWWLFGKGWTREDGRKLWWRH